ncbi:MAG: DUF4956 domain-containing protein [Spirochaetales bacterium]|nr:DUF4956 domain-containing protein [Spirochaetales bacterium]
METKLFPDIMNIVSIFIPVEQMLFNQAVAIIVALMISWVYKKTYSGIIYSKNFNITLVLVTVVTSVVMMVIGSNLALSLGMVGALSIIRFRSAIKDIRDIGYLFWGMSAGLAAGTGNHLIAVSGTIITGILMFIFQLYLVEQFSYLLIVKGDGFSETELETIFKDFSHKYKLKVKNSDKIGSEMIYEIQIKKKEEHTFVGSLKKIAGVKSINLLSQKGELIG